MEFKVWVEGIQRVICGVTPSTTSQDVIVALAQATGKTGRFTLVEQWRDNERLLAPSDNPLRVLHKYGEYASDVHFILRQSETDAGQKSRFTHNFTPPPSGGIVKRNLTFSGAHNSPTDFLPGYRQKRSKTPLSNAITEESDSVGNETRPAKPKQPPPYYMVERMLHDNLQRGRVIQENGHSSHKGVAHDRGSPHGGKAGQDGEWRSTQGHVETHEFIVSQPQATRRSTTPEVEGSGRQSRENVNGPVNYNSLERKKRHGDSPQVPVRKPRGPTDYHHDKRMPISMGADAHDISVTPESKYSNRTSPPKEPAAWSRRSPDGRSPPGSRSPVKSRRELREKETDAEEFDLELSLFREDGSGSDHIQHFQDKVMASKVSRDQLLKLITLQRQKLETQQAQMTNTDTDLTVLENREKDYDDKLDDVISQIRHLEVEDRQLSQEIAENESVRWADDITVQQQTEKTLQAELTLIRSRLANCESELLQCRNQTCRLTEELDQEAREQEVAAREEEAKIVEKVEHLKKKVELAETQAETDANVLAQVDNEITQQECQLEHKNQEASQLEGAIKQANLQTFSKVKPEKQDKDEKTTRTSTSPGSSKIGSVRKMTGSPQLLGETVPTTRNPQGLWV